ncbi:MAG: glycoside hydrolase family 2 TIM barrel-domain containing protein [Rikenellaceae bacterium]
MNKIRLRVLALTLICSMVLSVSGVFAGTLADGYPQSERTKLLINDGWRFHLGDADAKFYDVNLSDSDWEQVTVPHTLELTDINLNGHQDTKEQETFQRNVGWYRRDIEVSKSKKSVILEFEGVHQITTLWVNGRKVGTHSVGGYTPFYFDISNYVKRGARNQITILADNRISKISPPDPGGFDYILFSGLYRDVYLVERGDIHVTSNLDSSQSGVTITTPAVDYVNGNATIDIRTEVCNGSKKPTSITVVQRVVDADGEVVLKLSKSAVVAAGDRYRFIQTGGIDEELKLWGIDRPYLYNVNTTIYDSEGNALDVVDNRLGIRKVEYDPETGFRLNGKNIKLIGLNRHQHFAQIGDALPNSLHYKDVLQIKGWGFNTIRCAHYPHDDELVKACDELGILLYEEAPTWISMSKETEWYENEKRAAQAMIRNHKNSPSIIIWGAGINHRGAVGESQFVAKQEDPTRLTASQSSHWTGTQSSSWSDIYANMNYSSHMWEGEEPLLAMEGYWGAAAIAPYMRENRLPGMISWTAHAYYTFHDFNGAGDPEGRTFWGVLDAFRYPKDKELFWYPSEFMVKPYLCFRDSWTPDLKTLTIYSNATYIELFVNGKSRGIYYPSTAKIYYGLNHAPYEISDFKYEDGELTVVGYREGAEIIRESIYTPQSATNLRLSTNAYPQIDWRADGNDILVVYAEVVDSNGTKIEDYDGEVTFSVKGDATIVGDELGSGFNPATIHRGVARVLVRAGSNAGDITVTANCNALKDASIEAKTTPYERDMMVANSYLIKDCETVKIDLGGETQLCQFGWTSWDSSEQESASVTIQPVVLGDFVGGSTPPATSPSGVVESGTEGAYTFTIKGATSDGILRWLGEMNTKGHNGYVYGDGVLITDKGGAILSIEGLPVGNYKLKSYHHAPSSNTDHMDPNLENLKTLSINKLPYAKVISVSVDGEKEQEGVAVSAGNDQRYSPTATSNISFSVEEDGQIVEINYKSEDQRSGIWLNGLELVRYL